jgi:hypothetical protein
MLFIKASPLARMLSAIRVKSPFSHSALFGFIGRSNQFTTAGDPIIEAKWPR